MIQRINHLDQKSEVEIYFDVIEDPEFIEDFDIEFNQNKLMKVDFIEDNFLKELEVFQGSIIVPLGNSVSSTIDYLNTKHQLKLKCFLKGFPHPSGLNARKNIQFKENREEMCRLLTRVNF